MKKRVKGVSDGADIPQSEDAPDSSPQSPSKQGVESEVTEGRKALWGATQKHEVMAVKLKQDAFLFECKGTFYEPVHFIVLAGEGSSDPTKVMEALQKRVKRQENLLQKCKEVMRTHKERSAQLGTENETLQEQLQERLQELEKIKVANLCLTAMLFECRPLSHCNIRPYLINFR